jgi:hypothetical protein
VQSARAVSVAAGREEGARAAGQIRRAAAAEEAREVNVLSSLFGKRQPRNRPALESWVCAPALLVDGGGPGLEPATTIFPGHEILHHETADGPGLPFHFPDTRRLPAKSGAFRSVVLVEVLDKVIDVGAAIDEAARVVVAGGELVAVQSVAPEDFEQRAIWNAIAKMRDPRHASTPSSRQLAGTIAGLKMEIVGEAIWDETVDATTTLRPDVADRLALMLAAAAARGATDAVRDGKLVVERRAWRLRRPSA